MPKSDEDLDQLCADESGSSRDKHGRGSVACHMGSVECDRAGDHRHYPHMTRTTPVQAR